MAEVLSPLRSSCRAAFSTSAIMAILGMSLGVRANLGPSFKSSVASGGRGAVCSWSTGSLMLDGRVAVAAAGLVALLP